MSGKHAIVIVDVQNDFCEGGSLGVAGGAAAAAAITDWLRTARADHVVATRDHHIDPGDHFSDNPDFERSWPPHCVAGTSGADFHPAFSRHRVEAVFDKGDYAAAYSGFEGRASDPDTSETVDLASWLRAYDVGTLEIVGIATDYCVAATATDAVRAGFGTTVRPELTAAVNPDSLPATLDALRRAGVIVG